MPSTKGEGQGLNYEIIARLRPGSGWAEAPPESSGARLEQRTFGGPEDSSHGHGEYDPGAL